jgi:spore germination protein GerM
MNGRTARIVLVVAALLAPAACGFPAQSDAAPIPGEELPVGLRPGATSATAVPANSERVTIWLVDGERLVPVRHDVQAPAGVASVTNALLAGPTEVDQRRGLRSALPDPAVAVGAESSRGLATVELNESFAEISPEDQLLAVGQFVLTLTETPGVGSVGFKIAGEPVAVPLPTGESTDSPVFREQYIDLTAATASS